MNKIKNMLGTLKIDETIKVAGWPFILKIQCDTDLSAPVCLTKVPNFW